MKNLRAEISGFMIYSMHLIKKEIFIASHFHLAPSHLCLLAFFLFKLAHIGSCSRWIKM